MASNKKTAVEKALDKLAPDTGLKVGAKSSYFYCGTAEDFAENIDEYSFAAERRAEMKVRKARNSLKSLLETSVSPGDYAKQNIHAGEAQQKLTAQGYMDYLADYFKEVERRVKQRIAAEQALSKFTPLRNRDVIRFEKSDVEKNCFILILSGDEIGTYWMLPDAKNSHLSFTAIDSEDEEDE